MLRFKEIVQETWWLCHKSLISRKYLNDFKRKIATPWIYTPISKNKALNHDICPKTPTERKEMERVPYSNVIESLMYATMCTRPDISYTIGLVSHY